MTSAKILGGLILRKASDNAPVILTALGVAGTISTAVLAVRATPGAMSKIEADQLIVAKPVGDEENNWRLSKFGVVKLVWKDYIPTTLMAAGTIAAIIGANTVANKRYAALTAAYTLTDRAYREYKEQVISEVGEKTSEKIQAKVAKKKWDADDMGNKEVIIIGDGKTLCYDVYTGRSFLSSRQALEQAEIEVNKTIINSNYATLNDFWREVGLATTTPGENIGWNTNDYCDLAIAAIIVEDGQPALSVDFHVPPMPRPDRVW